MKLLLILKEILEHYFCHDWIEVAHDGPYTAYKCNKCRRTKTTSLL